MTGTYSTYEAKARFSEILRKVRGGETVSITYRGQEVAEIRPVEREPTTEETLRKLELRGLVGRQAPKGGRLSPIAPKPGALKRFLESRD